MAYLFKVNDKAVFPNEETLLLSPFKDIWERDESENKDLALQEFSYIEFMVSMKKSNPFRQYPENKKHDVIKEAVIFVEDWKPDTLVLQAIESIRQFQIEASTTYSYYMSAKRAAEKMQDFFNEVDIAERNFKTGNPIYKPKDITSALNDTERVLANLKALEKKVEEELYEETKSRANKQVSPLADPSSL